MLVAAGCYSPTLVPGSPCTSAPCPSGLVCTGGTCQLPGGADAAIDSQGDASGCFGTGLVTICPSAPPDGELSISISIDTDSSVLCAKTKTASPYCVLAAHDISIDTGGSVKAIGTRPLVLLATGTIDLAGTLDVASERAMGGASMPGAGADPSACLPLIAASSGGGGAGGSFGGAGGGGGNGAGGSGGGPAAPPITPTTLRGGCAGGSGAGSSPGAGGHGGGAVYLIASAAITVEASGVIDASGEGGDNGSLGGPTGGCGGGAGGMIGLDAPAVVIDGEVFANGGGGGGGGGTTSGSNGGDPTAPDQPATGGSAGSGAGAGGEGAAAMTLGGATGSAADGATGTGTGGGGGGGAGVIVIYGMLEPGAGQLSPPAM